MLFNPEYNGTIRPFPTGGDITAIITEWITSYPHGMGPRERYSARTWEDAFNSVGTFQARLTSTEYRPLHYRQQLVAHAVTHTIETPTLYRAATAENAAGWSWGDSLEAVRELLDYDDSVAGLGIWECTTPEHVFGTIAISTRRLGQHQHTTVTEYVIKPGTYRRVE